MVIERLAQKQDDEFQNHKDEQQKSIQVKLKPHRELFQLRQKQVLLMKMNLYNNSMLVKKKADILEEQEKSRLEKELSLKLDKKQGLLMRNHNIEKENLISKIQRERNDYN